jgi:hypothetical protein
LLKSFSVVQSCQMIHGYSVRSPNDVLPNDVSPNNVLPNNILTNNILPKTT